MRFDVGKVEVRCSRVNAFNEAPVEEDWYMFQPHDAAEQIPARIAAAYK